MKHRQWQHVLGKKGHGCTTWKVRLREGRATAYWKSQREGCVYCICGVSKTVQGILCMAYIQASVRRGGIVRPSVSVVYMIT